MLYFVQILYLLSLASSLDFQIGGQLKLGSKFHFTHTSSGLKNEPRNRTTVATPYKEISFNKSLNTSREDRPTLRHHKSKAKPFTSFSTKYESGTTGKQRRNSLKELRQHDHKRNPARNRPRIDHTTYTNPYVLQPPKKSQIAREGGEYVYTFVNNTVNGKGDKSQRIIIYNSTHYLQYTGKVIPRDYVHLYKLWTQIESPKPKEFDEKFRPPYWMEWHKPPWWMDWHSPPPPALRNDTWEIWNMPGLKPPRPTVVRNIKGNAEFSKWMGEIWSKIKHYNQQKKQMHPLNDPKGTRAAGDYVYTYVNNTVNAQGEKVQEIIIYNKTHYLFYNGNVVPKDYAHLTQLWTILDAAKKFDDVFRPPWWMEWHRPPWWMEWHTPPPGSVNDTWEIWNQPGMKRPVGAVGNSFDLTKLMGDLWNHVKSDRIQINSWKKVDADPRKVPSATRAGDYVYTYVNTTVNAKGAKEQRIIIYNKTHYLHYTGNVVPKDYLALCNLWATLNNAKEFDNVFKPPWWMEWHRPPWWMEWHTPPPGSLRNDTWEIWNQPGMKFPGRQHPSTTNTYVPFDLIKWLGQLWSEVNGDNTQSSTTNYDIPQPWLRQNDDIFQDRHRMVTNPQHLPIASHSLRDDKQINTFTKLIFNNTLKLFHIVKQKSPEHHWKRGIKYLAKGYESKYNEYLRTIKDRRIKSQQAIRKIIFNAIDVSHRIVKRLVNSMMHDLDKKKLLRNSPTPGIFQKEINRAHKSLLDSACSGFGFCKSDDGFIRFLLDIFDILLEVDDEKFRQAFGLLLDEALKSDFYIRYVNSDTYAVLKERNNFIKKQHASLQRAALTIIKNIIENRHSPLAAKPGISPENSIINVTLAFQEIMNKAEEVPSTEDNVREWNNIRNDFNNWRKGKKPRIYAAMTRFITHINNCVYRLNKDSFKSVLTSCKTLFYVVD